MLFQRVIIAVHFVHLFCSRDLKYQHSFMKIMYVCMCLCATFKYSPLLTNQYAELQYIPFYFCCFFVYPNPLFPSSLSTEKDKRIITYFLFSTHNARTHTAPEIQVESAIHFKNLLIHGLSLCFIKAVYTSYQSLLAHYGKGREYFCSPTLTNQDHSALASRAFVSDKFSILSLP